MNHNFKHGDLVAFTLKNSDVRGSSWFGRIQNIDSDKCIISCKGNPHRSDNVPWYERYINEIRKITEAEAMIYILENS